MEKNNTRNTSLSYGYFLTLATSHIKSLSPKKEQRGKTYKLNLISVF